MPTLCSGVISLQGSISCRGSSVKLRIQPSSRELLAPFWPSKIFMVLCPIGSQIYTNIDPHSTNASKNSRAMLVLASYSFASFQNALDTNCQLFWRSIHSQALSQKCCRFGDKGMVRFFWSHSSHIDGSWIQAWTPDLGDTAVPFWINLVGILKSLSARDLSSSLRRLQHQVGQTCSCCQR